MLLPFEPPGLIAKTILETCYLSPHVRWVSCHHGVARPQVTDGGDGLQIWRVAANIWNKQSRRADKGWYSSLGIRRGANKVSL
jgi:hypothetical protein